jgi:6-phosphogluconolactonase (cycloisomerase 2 family)
MEMKFHFLKHVLLPLSLLCMMACSGSNSTISSGLGVLYVTAQGNSSLSAYAVNLSTGGLSTVGAVTVTGRVPSAIAITPAVDALFVANSGSNTVTAYTINSDGSLSASTTITKVGLNPSGLAIDPGGKFLFVANQGWSSDPNSGRSSISVFAISGGTTLKAVPGSPFTTIPTGLSYPIGTLPVAVAVSNSGKFLYVANELANFVSVFNINTTSGALSQSGIPFYATGTSPSALAITPDGGFLYVANSGANSDNISAFFICDAIVDSCSNVNSPDGTLTTVQGSPFPAGLDPSAIAIDPAFNFLYVVNKGSNNISQYAFGRGDGVLTTLSPATISAGVTPVSIAVRSGATGTDIGNTVTNPTDWVYVANSGGGTISTFTLTTTTGLLSVNGAPLIVFPQTSALAVR